MSGDLGRSIASLAVALTGMIVCADLARCAEISDGSSSSLMTLSPGLAPKAPMGSTVVKVDFAATPEVAPDALAAGSAKQNSTITFGWETAPGSKSAASAERKEMAADYVDGAPPSVPLPTPFWSTMATLGGLAGIGVLRWFRRREV